MFKRRLEVWYRVIALKYGVIAAIFSVFVAQKMGMDSSYGIVITISAFYITSFIAPRIFRNYIVRGALREYVTNNHIGVKEIQEFRAHIHLWDMRDSDILYLEELVDKKYGKIPEA